MQFELQFKLLKTLGEMSAWNKREGNASSEVRTGVGMGNFVNGRVLE